MKVNNQANQFPTKNYNKRMVLFISTLFYLLSTQLTEFYSVKATCALLGDVTLTYYIYFYQIIILRLLTLEKGQMRVEGSFFHIHV